uniref:BTB domain-containing protein n=1 Tax=Ditylenchus dipsaci TaxID=166011 RepID=A0A915E6J8_9BILA
MHSEFFDKLFNANFAEKDKDIIELKSLSSKMFHEFLLVIYPCRKAVEGCRVAELLTFAEFYQVYKKIKPYFRLMEFVEIRECKLSAGMKLKLADRFDLTKLKARILRKLDDQKGLNKARDLQGLSAGTLQTIVRKTELVKSGVYKSDNYGGIDFESMDTQ